MTIGLRNIMSEQTINLFEKFRQLGGGGGISCILLLLKLENSPSNSNIRIGGFEIHYKWPLDIMLTLTPPKKHSSKSEKWGGGGDGADHLSPIL